MPTAPGRPCRGSRSARRCPALVTSRDGWCDDCRKMERKTRDARPDRVEALTFYKSKAWRRCRHHVLARDPLCVLCLAKDPPVIPNLSTIGDHWPRPLRWYLERGLVSEAADPTNSRGVCKDCHDRKELRAGRAKQLGRNG